MDVELAKTRFNQALNNLVTNSPMSLKAIKEAARRNGIGYSTLHSWRSGEHLPQVPEDNPSFRAFVHEIAASPADAREVMRLATQAWRASVRAKNHAARRPSSPGQAGPAGNPSAVAVTEADESAEDDWDGIPWPARRWSGWRGKRGWGRCGWRSVNLDLGRGIGVDSVEWPNCPTR